jgi:hypothetical protein
MASREQPCHHGKRQLDQEQQQALAEFVHSLYGLLEEN